MCLLSVCACSGFGFVIYRDPTAVDKVLSGGPHQLDSKIVRDISAAYLPFVSCIVDISVLWPCLVYIPLTGPCIFTVLQRRIQDLPKGGGEDHDQHAPRMPIMGVWERSPQWGQSPGGESGGEAWSWKIFGYFHSKEGAQMMAKVKDLNNLIHLFDLMI